MEFGLEEMDKSGFRGVRGLESRVEKVLGGSDRHHKQYIQ